MALSTPASILSLLLALLLFLAPARAQNAALGGGVAGAAQAATQYPVVSNVASLVTVGGTVTTEAVVFTQTFVTPLGTWAFPTPSAGSVGLGNIQGTVGAVHN